jgi:predicted lipoprotein with Yx(FWY)xxD motif
MIMKLFLNRAAGACAGLLLSVAAADAATMLTAKNGMTIYSFDKDAGGISACYDACAAMWPAYVGKADDPLTEGWTLVKRTDGAMQWAYDGKPMYFFASDKKAGDKLGDGMGGKWHVIVE